MLGYRRNSSVCSTTTSEAPCVGSDRWLTSPSSVASGQSGRSVSSAMTERMSVASSPAVDVDPLPEPAQRRPAGGDREVAPAQLAEGLLVRADQDGVDERRVGLHREDPVGRDVAAAGQQPVRGVVGQEPPQRDVELGGDVGLGEERLAQARRARRARGRRRPGGRRSGRPLLRPTTANAPRSSGAQSSSGGSSRAMSTTASAAAVGLERADEQRRRVLVVELGEDLRQRARGRLRRAAGGGPGSRAASDRRASVVGQLLRWRAAVGRLEQRRQRGRAGCGRPVERAAAAEHPPGGAGEQRRHERRRASRRGPAARCRRRRPASGRAAARASRGGRPGRSAPAAATDEPAARRPMTRCRMRWAAAATAPACAPAPSEIRSCHAIAIQAPEPGRAPVAGVGAQLAAPAVGHDVVAGRRPLPRARRRRDPGTTGRRSAAASAPSGRRRRGPCTSGSTASATGCGSGSTTGGSPGSGTTVSAAPAESTVPGRGPTSTRARPNCFAASIAASSSLSGSSRREIDAKSPGSTVVRKPQLSKHGSVTDGRRRRPRSRPGRASRPPGPAPASPGRARRRTRHRGPATAG